METSFENVGLTENQKRLESLEVKNYIKVLILNNDN